MGNENPLDFPIAFVSVGKSGIYLFVTVAFCASESEGSLCLGINDGMMT